jgi:predicted glycoside hydrolase/deacetylase ChbG (UPF0249 family)
MANVANVEEKDMADSFATRLGYPADARLVIFHADDVGVSHGSNRALIELVAAGMVKSGSIMAPCPWATEMLALCQEHPDLDVGVHLTLTCEWTGYRWGPLTTRNAASGLIQEDGSFWATTPDVHARADIDYAAVELRAQVERVVAAGIAITHLDSHMGVNWSKSLFDLYTALGRDYRVPIFYPQDQDAVMRRTWPRNEAFHAHALAALQAAGLPAVDYIRISPCYASAPPDAPSAEVYEAVLRGLEPGITHFALHPNAPGDIEAIDLKHSRWRVFEYGYFQSTRLARFLEAEGIIPIGYRDLCHALRQSQA